MTKKAIMITGTGIVVGAIAGYLYYYFVGCASGNLFHHFKTLEQLLIWCVDVRISF